MSGLRRRVAKGSRERSRAAPSRSFSRICRALIPCYTDRAANLTITIEDEVLKRARVRAVELGTSVNAILAEHLRAFAGRDDARMRATATLLALAKQNHEQGGAPRAKARGRRRWTREDLHER